MNILILCTGNSCRSQIAHGYLQRFAGPRATVYSAGIETHGLNPRAVATMKADGLDISENTSNHVDEYMNVPFDFIITVCDHAREHCPYIPSNATRLHHSFPDPAKATGTEEEVAQQFAAVRDEIRQYCKDFVLQYLS